MHFKSNISIEPPAAKKRKTGPNTSQTTAKPSTKSSTELNAPEVVDDDGDIEQNGAKAAVEEDDEDAEVDEDEADDTAKKSGPAASAKANKGSVVPKEDELKEVDDAE